MVTFQHSFEAVCFGEFPAVWQFLQNYYQLWLNLVCDDGLE
jgi:hypothetical protein